MVVCPVCEHPQGAGPECEVCGHRLQALSDAVPSLPALDGLEPTFLPAVRGVSTETEPVPGLELTGAAPVPAPPGMIIPDLEPTKTSPVDPPIAALPGVERVGDGAPADEPTPYPAVVVCRYCRTEAGYGERICSRCGMRLPTAAAPAPEPAAGGPERMCSCGLPVRGPRCPSCGARTG